MQAVILAAGMGTRLGTMIPKPLTALRDEETVLDVQVEKLARLVGRHAIWVVVGYRKELIMEKHPDLIYVFNHQFAQTNTARSLSAALEKMENQDVIWLNGDVFFEAEALDRLAACPESSCLVKEDACGEEEIKYACYDDGMIREISKRVNPARGEAVGINLIRAGDLAAFKQALREASDHDYFERALENLTRARTLRLRPISARGLFCEEIDFPEDLDRVMHFLAGKREG
jgi:choline kinase